VLAVVYLIVLSVAGAGVVNRMMPSAPAMVRICGGFLLGIVSSAWVTYLVALGLSGVTDESLLIGIVLTTVLNAAVIVWCRDSLRLSHVRMSAFEVLFLGAALAFSFWLMDNRLFVAGDVAGDPVLVSSETWGDTALHVALSRSFSEGANYPTEYPFFANDPIRYHFGYDFFAGALQEGGLSVVLSFNLPGALAFTAMMALMLSLGRMLFSVNDGKQRRWWEDRGVWGGLIAVALLMTNQSLQVIRYFETTGSFSDALNPDTWWNHTGYLSIGPYTADKIAIFNTLNVFLTQTHLIVGMAVVLFVAFGLLQPLRFGQRLPRDRMLLLGVLFGASFWLNGVLFIAAGIFFGTLLVVFAVSAACRHAQGSAVGSRGSEFWRELWRWVKASVWFIAPALLLAIPQAIWLNGGLGNDGSIRQHIGYLVCSSPNANCNANGEMDPLDPSHWVEFGNYWLLNQGLMIPLLIFAFVIAKRSDLKILAAIMAVFIFGSLFQLSRDLGGHNHKIFNLWEILASLFVAYALVELWNIGRGMLGALNFKSPALQPVTWVLVPVLFFGLVVSGLLDFMTIKNDWEVDVFGENQAAVVWIEENTEGDAVFLVAWGDLYTAPTLAGRGVFLGYDPWVSSAGYDAAPRKETITAIYGAGSKGEACGLLRENDIDYVLIGRSERGGTLFPLNEQLFRDEFTLAGSAPQGADTIDIYDVSASCAV